MIRRFKIGNLVRDKMPERIKKLGGYVNVQTLNPQDYLHYLKLKLQEETDEILAATTPKDVKEEIADVLEVLHALAKKYGLLWEHIEKKRLHKLGERGGFNKALYAEFVEAEESEDSDTPHPVIEYCLSSPEKYPEV